MWSIFPSNNYFLNDRSSVIMNYQYYLLVISLIWELRYFSFPFSIPSTLNWSKSLIQDALSPLVCGCPSFYWASNLISYLKYCNKPSRTRLSIQKWGPGQLTTINHTAGLPIPHPASLYPLKALTWICVLYSRLLSFL